MPGPPPGLDLPSLLDVPGASSLRLKSSQRGTVVRGSLVVARKGSKLVVRALARRNALSRSSRSSLRVQVGRQQRSPVQGRTSFGVALNATARRALRRDGRLAIGLRITVTPPAEGRSYKATRTVTLRPA